MTANPEAAPANADGAGRLRRRELVRGLLLVAAGLGGAVLMALPWLPLPTAMPLEGEITAGSPGHAHLLQVAREADAACAAGDVEGLRRAVSEAFARRIEAVLHAGGRRWDAASLREQGAVVGDLGALELVAGRAVGRRAVLVLSSARVRRDGGYPARPALTVVTFAWSGRTFVLDGARSQALRDDAEAAVQSQAQGLLSAGLEGEH